MLALLLIGSLGEPSKSLNTLRQTNTRNSYQYTIAQSGQYDANRQTNVRDFNSYTIAQSGQYNTILQTNVRELFDYKINNISNFNNVLQTWTLDSSGVLLLFGSINGASVLSGALTKGAFITVAATNAVQWWRYPVKGST